MTDKIVKSNLIGDIIYEGITQKYNMGVLANNGNIYCPPFSSSKVLVINPTTKKTTFIGDEIKGTNSYSSGVLANNGKIYCPPLRAKKVLVINPDDDTIEFIEIKNLDDTQSSFFYECCILADNGNIDCPPGGATNILKIIPDKNEAKLILQKIGKSKTQKYNTGVLADNGKIYCPPGQIDFNESESGDSYGKVLIIDTIKEKMSYIEEHIKREKIYSSYYSAVYVDNRIYCPPFSATKVLIIDTNSEKIKYIGQSLNIGFPEWKPVSGSGDIGFYRSAILADNDIIYCIPCNALQILRIDPKTNDVNYIGSEISNNINNQNYHNSVLADNGNIYSPPFGSYKENDINLSKVLELDIPKSLSNKINVKFVSDKLSDNEEQLFYKYPILADNGNIYCPPYNSDKVLEINIPKNEEKNNLPLILGLVLGLGLPIIAIVAYVIYRNYKK